MLQSCPLKQMGQIRLKPTKQRREWQGSDWSCLYTRHQECQSVCTLDRACKHCTAADGRQQPADRAKGCCASQAAAARAKEQPSFQPEVEEEPEAVHQLLPHASGPGPAAPASRGPAVLAGEQECSNQGGGVGSGTIAHRRRVLLREGDAALMVDRLGSHMPEPDAVGCAVAMHDLGARPPMSAHNPALGPALWPMDLTQSCRPSKHVILMMLHGSRMPT